MNDVHRMEYLDSFGRRPGANVATSVKYNKTCAKPFGKLETCFPEKIIGCKLMGKDIVTVSSRNVMYIRKSSDLELKKQVQCDYYATSICSLILRDHSETDSFRIFFGSVIGELIDWKPNEDSKPKKRTGHKGMIFSMVHDSSRLFTISDDRTIRMWSLADRDSPPVFSAFGHAARPYAICIDSNRNLIYTGGIEETLFCWAYDNFEIKLKSKSVLSTGVIRQIKQNDDTSLTIFSQDDDSFKISTNTEARFLMSHDTVLNFAHVKKNFVVLSAANELMIYEDDSMKKLIFRLKGMRHLSTADKSIVAWNKSVLLFFDGVHVTRLKFSISIISAICYKNYIAVKTINGFIQIVSLENRETFKVLKKFRVQNPSMIPSVFMVNGDFLVVGTTHGELFCGRLTENTNKLQSLSRQDSFRCFGGKEVTFIKPITGTHSFMTLGKSGIWSTMSLENCVEDVDAKVHILNSRSFSSKSRMAWPSRIIEIEKEMVIVGFYGTSVILWNAKSGYPIYDSYCGGGHRAWDLRRSTLDSRVLYFDAIRENHLYRQKIDVTSAKYINRSAHTSPIISAAGSDHFLVTVSLDGHLSIGNETGTCTFLTMFVGDNLLCTDIREGCSNKMSFVTAGGGNGKLSIWKFQKKDIENNTFHLRHVMRQDEGRIVNTKIVKSSNGSVFFIAAFSSGKLEVFNEYLESICTVDMEDELGIASKIDVCADGDLLSVGTSGSYMLLYSMANTGELSEKNRFKLSDRSGVTSIASSSRHTFLIGCDSGNVFRFSWNDCIIEKIHSHLSTVVGIVIDDGDIHSVSLDCVLLTSLDKGCTDQVIRSPTNIDVPSGVVRTGECNVVVVGNGLQIFNKPL